MSVTPLMEGLSDLDHRLVNLYLRKLGDEDAEADPELEKELQNPASAASERLRDYQMWARSRVDLTQIPGMEAEARYVEFYEEFCKQRGKDT